MSDPTAPAARPRSQGEEVTGHPAWPEPGEHLWSEWAWKRGLPKPIQYRTCLHPECKEVETKEGLKG